MKKGASSTPAMHGTAGVRKRPSHPRRVSAASR